MSSCDAAVTLGERGRQKDDLVRLLLHLGAEAVPHDESNLMVHLQGVYALLHQWGLPDEVARAGLFHAAYGSESYPGLCLPITRPDLRQVIGAYSEQLVYWYCAATPASVEHSIRFQNSMWLWSRFDEEHLRIEDDDFTNLLWLYFANAAEQDERLSRRNGTVPSDRVAFIPVWYRLAEFLGPTAQEHCRSVYGSR